MLKIKTLLFVTSIAIASAAQAQPVLMPSGANIDVVQNDASNSNTSITLSLPTKINNFNVGAANRGDINLYVGPTARSNLTKGIYISSVAQNGRNNDAAGGNVVPDANNPAPTGTVFSTTAIDASATGQILSTFYTSTSTNATTGNPVISDEFNVNVSGMYFPFSVDGKQGFVGGYALNTTNGSDITDAASSFSPGISVGTNFTKTASGNFLLNLNGVPGAPATGASQSGILLVNGGKNEANYALSQANADGTFSLFVHDNTSNGASYEQDPVVFAYIPANTPGLVAGRINGSTAPVAAAGTTSGTFSVSASGTGQVLLKIPGVTSPNDGVLVISPEGGVSSNTDNIINYEWNAASQGYVIQGRDLPLSATPGNPQNVGTEPMFSFAFLPTPKVDNSGAVTNFARFLGARVEAAETLVGLNSSTGTLVSGTGGAPLLQTTASILAGSNSSAAAKMVEISWRTRTTSETSGAGQPALISDVARVTGLAGEVFTLQMNYNQTLLESLGGNESAILASGELHLAWLNNGSWVNAIDGNSTVGTSAKFHQQMSWTDFVTANPGVSTNLANFLGSWGIDPVNNQAWAVLNHNSDFAVIPEPTSYAFAGVAAALVAWRRVRRNDKAPTAR